MASFIVPRLKKQFVFINDSLKGKEFFVDNKLTGADIMMSFLAEGLLSGPLNENDYPEILRWYNGLSQREAFKKAEAKGGKVDLSRFSQKKD
jgi:glutathione S-transferase